MKTEKTKINTLKLMALPFVGFSLIASQTGVAVAAIDNTATATGTYGGNPVNSPPDAEAVTVTPAAAGLTVVKAVRTTPSGAPSITAGTDNTISDAGDTIVYTYAVTNSGNVTMTNVSPVDAGPTFGANAATGAAMTFTPASVATLAPGATANFTGTYIMTALDIARSAGITNDVDNTATATGTRPNGTTYTSPASNIVETTIPAGPLLRVTKSFVLTDIAGGTNQAGTADVGETITYTYLVENIGNVTFTNANVADTHEGAAVAAASITHAASLTSNGTLGAAASPDNNASASVWGTLAPGASVSFTYAHTVNQTEFNNQ